MSQKDVIYGALRSAGERGCCIEDFGRIDWTCVLTARNRVAELRAEGLDIVSAPCRIHRHRSKSVARYELRSPVGQLALGGLG